MPRNPAELMATHEQIGRLTLLIPCAVCMATPGEPCHDRDGKALALIKGLPFRMHRTRFDPIFVAFKAGQRYGRHQRTMEVQQSVE